METDQDIREALLRIATRAETHGGHEHLQLAINALVAALAIKIEQPKKTKGNA